MANTRQQTVWRFDGRVAELHAGYLTARVDPARPGAGLHHVRIDEQALVGAFLLGARFSRTVTSAPAAHADQKTVRESYVRGVDFVATYPQESGSIAAAHVYWRAIVPESDWPACGVELIVSIQTSLLESHPTFTSVTAIDAVSAHRLSAPPSDRFSPLALGLDREARCTPENGPGVFLLRLPGGAFSYVELIHPSDFRGITVAATSPPPSGARADEAPRRFTLASTLFLDRLEKGVIRRGRLAGIFVPREDDERAAARFYRTWIASPPPLTA